MYAVSAPSLQPVLHLCSQCCISAAVLYLGRCQCCISAAASVASLQPPVLHLCRHQCCIYAVASAASLHRPVLHLSSHQSCISGAASAASLQLPVLHLCSPCCISAATVLTAEICRDVVLAAEMSTGFITWWGGGAEGLNPRPRPKLRLFLGWPPTNFLGSPLASIYFSIITIMAYLSNLAKKRDSPTPISQ